MTYFVVATNGNGLYIRETPPYSTTVYSDRTINEFDTWEEADAFVEDNDEFYYDYD